LPEIIVFVLVISLITFLVCSNIYLYFKKRNIAKMLFQTAIDKNLLANKLNEELDRKYNKPIDQTEGFIKFLSDSRDSAFEYIEDVQAAIINLRSAMKLGTSDDITKAYQNLMFFVPKDEEES
jgi:hypothetical protein